MPLNFEGLHIQETKPKIQKVPLIDATREELQEAL
jgi:hypothetical protein